jgi:hypothetical protein
MFALTAGPTPAQQPLPMLPPPNAQPAQPGQPDPNDPEVLARGPVHEAFAATAEPPAASPLVPQRPPEPIEELPPEEKPDGDDVQWIPGYWHWDDDADRFIWISGFWRVPPPGRVWVAGSWREAAGGWQWAPGFWQEAAVPQPQQMVQPEIQYLPQPPAPIEVGPSVPAPTGTSFYVPGSWVWRGRFVWRPGFWIEHRPGWVWVPAHFRWSPVGYVFVDGYWDYPLAGRGVLYAPVYFPRPVYTRPAFVYTPAYVVSEPCMVGALFVRRGFGNYYFGDYFAPRYSTIGFTAWCGTVGRAGGFSVGFGVGRTWGYDPLWSYYSVTYRRNPDWFAGVGNLYGGRYRGDIARPPVTLVQQNTVINHITNVNVTNVTNNVTVVNRNVTVNNRNVTDVAMLAPAKAARDLQPEVKMKPITAALQREEARNAQQIRDVGVQRARLEHAAAARGGAVVKTTDPPKTLKLDVPKTVAARTVVKDEHKAPPVNPQRDLKAATKVDPRADHKPDPHPVFNPKVPPTPKLDLKPKHDPKPPTHPGKIDPKGPLPKVDPKGPPPKVDPKPPLNPLPRIEPKPPVPTRPKFEPRQPPVVTPPKGDPKPPVPPVGRAGLVNPTPRPLPTPTPAPVVRAAVPTKPPVARSAPVVVHPKLHPHVVQTRPPVNHPQPRIQPAKSPAHPPKEKGRHDHKE